MHREPWIPSDEELAAALDAMRPVVAAFARRDAGRLAQWSSTEATGSVATAARPRRRVAVLTIPV
jgi:hypothetical protein